MNPLKWKLWSVIGGFLALLLYGLKKRGDIHAERAEKAREGERRAEANLAAAEKLSRHRVAVDKAVIDGQRRGAERVREAVREAADDENLDHFR